jgi:hypothetical protein
MTENGELLQLAGKFKRQVNNIPCREAAYLNHALDLTA